MGSGASSGVRRGVRRIAIPRRAKRTARARFMPDAIEDADLRWFRRAARWHAPPLDATLPKLTRSANKSLLWAAIAAVMWVFGGRYERRAALRGIFGIAVTSFVTNIPAKLLWRRKRPDIDPVPKIRRVARLPTSTSFPSGHSASAFAFATGVALERPAIGLPLLGVASAVAYSRVYVGVHYPSDVIAGAAIGAGLAIATRRFWPVAPDEPAKARPAMVDLSERPDADGTGLAIVVNPQAGSGWSGPPTDELAEALPGAEILEIGEELKLDEALEKAAASGRVIGVSGGDGTVNAAAAVALEADKPLLVIPGGTLNHFARDIGMESTEDVVAAVERGDAIGIDVGLIDGKPFLNTASFGSYVDLVDARERLERQLGKWPAVAVALTRVLRNAEPAYVDIDGKTMPVWMAFIGNCRYRPEGFTPSWRDRLDDGILDIRIVSASVPFARMRLLWAVLTGTLSKSSVYKTEFVRGPVQMRCPMGPIRLARDGETFNGSEEFRIEKSSQRLVVLVPPSPESPSPGSSSDAASSASSASSPTRRSSAS